MLSSFVPSRFGFRTQPVSLPSASGNISFPALTPEPFTFSIDASFFKNHKIATLKPSRKAIKLLERKLWGPDNDKKGKVDKVPRCLVVPNMQAFFESRNLSAKDEERFSKAWAEAAAILHYKKQKLAYSIPDSEELRMRPIDGIGVKGELYVNSMDPAQNADTNKKHALTVRKQSFLYRNDVKIFASKLRESAAKLLDAVKAENAENAIVEKTVTSIRRPHFDPGVTLSRLSIDQCANVRHGESALTDVRQLWKDLKAAGHTSLPLLDLLAPVIKEVTFDEKEYRAPYAIGLKPSITLGGKTLNLWQTAYDAYTLKVKPGAVIFFNNELVDKSSGKLQGLAHGAIEPEPVDTSKPTTRIVSNLPIVVMPQSKKRQRLALARQEVKQRSKN